MENGQSEKLLIEDLVFKMHEILTELELESMKLDNFDTMNNLYRELDILSKQYEKIVQHPIVEKM